MSDPIGIRETITWFSPDEKLPATADGVLIIQVIDVPIEVGAYLKATDGSHEPFWIDERGDKTEVKFWAEVSGPVEN